MGKEETELTLLENNYNKAIKSNDIPSIIKASEEIVQYLQNVHEIPECIKYSKNLIPYLITSEMDEELAHKLNYSVNVMPYWKITLMQRITTIKH